MMLSLLGSLLGFGTSIIPKVMGYFEEKRDQAHELSMMDKQLEQQLQIGKQKLQTVNVDADIRETETLHKEHSSITRKSSQWCINLSASVRPIVTYILFLEFIGLTLSVNMGWIDMPQYNMIWSNEMQAIWAAVVCFWFGQRTFNRK